MFIQLSHTHLYAVHGDRKLYEGGRGVNLYQLYYFKTLAHLEHYTKAAEQLSMTQPSLSHAIKGIEEDLGVQLFRKNGRNISLAKYGKLFLPYVEKSIKVLEEGINTVREVSSKENGIISIGFIYTLSSRFIPGLIMDFLKQYPDSNVKFVLQEGDTQSECTDNIISGLKEEKFDLAFIAKPLDDPDIELIPIFEQNLVVIMSAKNALSEMEQIDLRDLAEYPLIQYSGKIGLKKEINSLFSQVSVIPKVYCEVEDEFSMAGLVAANQGVSIVPESEVFYDIDEIRVIPITNPSYKRMVYLAQRSNYQLIEPVRQFKNSIIGKKYHTY